MAREGMFPTPECRAVIAAFLAGSTAEHESLYISSCGGSLGLGMGQTVAWFDTAGARITASACDVPKCTVVNAAVILVMCSGMGRHPPDFATA